MPPIAAELEPWRRRLYLPAYRISDAAKYSDVAPQTVTHWHHGDGRLGPALPGHRKREHLSYLQLVEVAFVATFRKLGVSLHRIRKARSYAAQVLNAEYPFAEYKWLTEGHHAMLDLIDVDVDASFGSLVVGDARGQIAWQEMVGARFAQFDYEEDLALKWHVRGRDIPVVIDPRKLLWGTYGRGRPHMGAQGTLERRGERFRHRGRLWARRRGDHACLGFRRDSAGSLKMGSTESSSFGDVPVLFFDRDVGNAVPRALGVLMLPTSVEYHQSHFPTDAQDDVWMAQIGALGMDADRPRQPTSSGRG